MDPNETLRIIQTNLQNALTTTSKEEFLSSMIIIADFANMAFEWVDNGGFLPTTYTSELPTQNS